MLEKWLTPGPRIVPICLKYTGFSRCRRTAKPLLLLRHFRAAMRGGDLAVHLSIASARRKISPFPCGAAAGGGPWSLSYAPSWPNRTPGRSNGHSQPCSPGTSVSPPATAPDRPATAVERAAPRRARTRAVGFFSCRPATGWRCQENSLRHSLLRFSAPAAITPLCLSRPFVTRSLLHAAFKLTVTSR